MKETLTRHFSKSKSSVYFSSLLYISEVWSAELVLAIALHLCQRYREIYWAQASTHSAEHASGLWSLPLTSFWFHCSSTHLHVPSILKKLPSFLLLLLLSFDNYTSWKYLYYLPYSMIYLLLSYERVISPFIGFLNVLPVDTLMYLRYHYHLGSIHMHWIQAVWMDPELMLREFQFMCLIGQTHLFHEKTWHGFFKLCFHQNNIKIQ